MTRNDLAEWEVSLGHHVLQHSMEGNDFEAHIDDDIEWDYRDWSIQHVDTKDGFIEVEATQKSSQSERVSRGSRLQPPEYKNHKVTLRAFARAKWTEDDPLAGECEVHIEQEGGIPSPPDPEPYDDRL